MILLFMTTKKTPILYHLTSPDLLSESEPYEFPKPNTNYSSKQLQWWWGNMIIGLFVPSQIWCIINFTSIGCIPTSLTLFIIYPNSTRYRIPFEAKYPNLSSSRGIKKTNKIKIWSFITLTHLNHRKSTHTEVEVKDNS